MCHRSRTNFGCGHHIRDPGIYDCGEENCTGTQMFVRVKNQDCGMCREKAKRGEDVRRGEEGMGFWGGRLRETRDYVDPSSEVGSKNPNSKQSDADTQAKERRRERMKREMEVGTGGFGVVEVVENRRTRARLPQHQQQQSSHREPPNREAPIDEGSLRQYTHSLNHKYHLDQDPDLPGLGSEPEFADKYVSKYNTRNKTNSSRLHHGENRYEEHFSKSEHQSQHRTAESHKSFRPEISRPNLPESPRTIVPESSRTHKPESHRSYRPKSHRSGYPETPRIMDPEGLRSYIPQSPLACRPEGYKSYQSESHRNYNLESSHSYRPASPIIHEPDIPEEPIVFTNPFPEKGKSRRYDEESHIAPSYVAPSHVSSSHVPSSYVPKQKKYHEVHRAYKVTTTRVYGDSARSQRSDHTHRSRAYEQYDQPSEPIRRKKYAVGAEDARATSVLWDEDQPEFRGRLKFRDDISQDFVVVEENGGDTDSLTSGLDAMNFNFNDGGSETEDRLRRRRERLEEKEIRMRERDLRHMARERRHGDRRDYGGK